MKTIVTSVISTLKLIFLSVNYSELSVHQVGIVRGSREPTQAVVVSAAEYGLERLKLLY